MQQIFFNSYLYLHWSAAEENKSHQLGWRSAYESSIHYSLKLVRCFHAVSSMSDFTSLGRQNLRENYFVRKNIFDWFHYQ